MRMHTKNIKKAFWFINEKNKIEGNKWRVAAKVRNRVIIDIDSISIDNLRSIKDFYENLLGIEFGAIRTNGGYHLISRKYTDSIQCQYDQCRILYPELKTNQIQRYIEQIEKWYVDESKKYNVGDMKVRFVDRAMGEFKSGILCSFPETFEMDILFLINVLRKGYYCIRISKKNENDNPIKIIL